MPQTYTRKCTKCKEKIEIDLNNISGIVRYNNLFYHSDCFVEYCNERAAESGSLVWQKYINDMTKFENAAKEKIYYTKTKDDFDDYLLKHYDVQEVETRFWMTVAQLEKGKYKQRKCKPASVSTLFAAWRWGQKNLDSINRKNKQNKKGPKTDAERIFYDLSIIIKHIPDYIKYKAKLDAEEAEREAKEKERVKIDYRRFNKTPVKTEGLDDISDMLDDF